MNNNKAPGPDQIAVEMIKYGTAELHQCIANALNQIIETNNMEDAHELGKSTLRLLQKPKKEIGPPKNLRPINLLNTIRKILSNITLSRISEQTNQYLSPSQSAYRPGRSTTDAVWAHRWIAAKAQKYRDVKVYITGIDMSAAFDTVERHKLLEELKDIIGNNEIRIAISYY